MDVSCREQLSRCSGPCCDYCYPASSYLHAICLATVSTVVTVSIAYFTHQDAATTYAAGFVAFMVGACIGSCASVERAHILGLQNQLSYEEHRSLREAIHTVAIM